MKKHHRPIIINLFPITKEKNIGCIQKKNDFTYKKTSNHKRTLTEKLKDFFSKEYSYKPSSPSINSSFKHSKNTSNRINNIHN